MNFKSHLLLLSVLLLLTASAIAQSTHPRDTIPFDNDWRFLQADSPDAKEIKFDDSHWQSLTLPHDWSIEGPVNPPPTGDRNTGYFVHGIGWYRKSFVTPDTAKKAVVEFDGIYMNSDVWINGSFLGRRPYGYINIRYDITEYLKKDGSLNVLAVRVDDSAEPSVRWYAGSGIYRHVRLITTGFTQFRLDGGVFVTTPEISAAKATVKADYIIDANFLTEAQRQAWLKDAWGVKPETKEVVVQSSTISPEGKIITTVETKLTLQSMKRGKLVSQLISVPMPQLWSDKMPVLYKLQSTLLLNGQKLDETTTTFGIRSLRFDSDKGLFVNGKPTKLKGCLCSPGCRFFWQCCSCSRLGVPPRCFKGDGLQCHTAQPSSVCPRILRPV